MDLLAMLEGDAGLIVASVVGLAVTGVAILADARSQAAATLAKEPVRSHRPS